MKRLISALVHSDDILWSKEDLMDEFGVDSNTYDVCKDIAELLKTSNIHYDDIHEWSKK